MEVPQVNGKKNIKKLVMLHECGLCIHKEEGEDNKWIISHFASGRSVLKYIKSKCDA